MSGKENAMKIISIHAPREGSDFDKAPMLPDAIISIHAPREGSDFADQLNYVCLEHFNPRSPRGERHE